MDPLINADPPDTEPEPTIPLALLKRLLHLFSVSQLVLLVDHGEEVACPSRYGEIVLTYRDGKLHTIGHQVSDRA